MEIKTAEDVFLFLKSEGCDVDELTKLIQKNQI